MDKFYSNVYNVFDTDKYNICMNNRGSAKTFFNSMYGTKREIKTDLNGKTQCNLADIMYIGSAMLLHDSGYDVIVNDGSYLTVEKED